MRNEAQMEKMREEERQVEALKKQMYLAGQGGRASSDFVGGNAVSNGEGPLLDSGQRKEQRQAQQEFQRRRAALKRQHQAADADDPDEAEGLVDGAAAKVEAVPLATSMYREDFHPLGHQSVWGSWYDAESKTWGFSCCKIRQRKQRCPLAPEVPELAAAASTAEPRGKRRRKGNKDLGKVPDAVKDATAVSTDLGKAPAAVADAAAVNTDLGKAPAAVTDAAAISTDPGKAPAAVADVASGAPAATPAVGSATAESPTGEGDASQAAAAAAQHEMN